MELNFTESEIKKLIEISKSAEIYTDDDEIWDILDAEIDSERDRATNAKILLDSYFENHPEDNIENYL